MLIECLVRRDGPIIVPIGNEVYHFEPDAKGRRVADVWFEPHVEMFLASGASALYRKVEDSPPRRDDPAYRGPDPVIPPANAETIAPIAATIPPNGATLPPEEPEPPLSPEALAQPGIGGIGGYAAPVTGAIVPPPAAAAPANGKPPVQAKFSRKELIARAKELGINNPHGTPSATLELAIRERTS